VAMTVAMTVAINLSDELFICAVDHRC
jgi:hypothetical protein